MQGFARLAVAPLTGFAQASERPRLFAVVALTSSGEGAPGWW